MLCAHLFLDWCAVPYYTCGQQFNQFNEAKDSSSEITTTDTDMTDY